MCTVLLLTICVRGAIHSPHAADSAIPSSAEVLGGALTAMASELATSTNNGDTASVIDTCSLAVMVLQVGLPGYLG